MASSRPLGATSGEIRAVDNAFADRRHDAERYREEAACLRREAELRANLTVSDELMAVARQFDELAASVDKMRARIARR